MSHAIPDSLAVLPLIYTLRVRRAGCGRPNVDRRGRRCPAAARSRMVTVQRYEHIVEIMTQNVLLCITAVLLLRPKAAKLLANAQTAPTPAL